MKLWKIFLGLFGIVVLAIGAMVWAFFYFVTNSEGAAEAFFASLRAQDFAKARSYLTREFQESIPEAQFREFVASHRLELFQSVSWDSRSRKNSTSKIVGTLTLQSGENSTWRVALVQEGGDWKIERLAQNSGEGTLPSREAQLKLVSDSMRAFSLSIKAKDMAPFYQYVSPLWRADPSLAELKGQFQTLVDQGFDFTPLQNETPELTEKASIDEDGLLVLRALYSTPTRRALLRLQYHWGQLGWMLAGFEIKAQQATPKPGSPQDQNNP